jgi:AcrR family transcriptional regulator
MQQECRITLGRMPEHVGAVRPGGRTARTRAAVHDAARELLAETRTTPTMAAIAARSGVHPTTVYRRWGTVESILLDLAVADIAEASPVPATGDLREDLTRYTRQLLGTYRDLRTSPVVQALGSAVTQAQGSDEVDAVRSLMEPRVQAFQAMLDAAHVTRIDGLRVIELVLAPALLWSHFGMPLDPQADTDRLVDSVLCLASAPS